MWKWLDKVKQFFNAFIGRAVDKQAVTGASNLNLAINVNNVDTLTTNLINGNLSLGAWQQGMRDLIKQSVIQQYALGRGGIAQMTQREWGSIGGIIADQYRYLDGFAADLAAGNLTPGQALMRARMYINSAREAYNKAKARAWGLVWNRLPQYPGDGATECLCITTPESRVLTSVGWKPMRDVSIGDYVLTHKNQYKRVVAKIIKDGGGEYEYFVKAHTGAVVGCTGNHYWLSAFERWQKTINCYKHKLPLISKRDDNSENDVIFTPEIAEMRLLPKNAPVYDITVEDDHSFVIEGMVSHNTNCQCTWEFEAVEENGAVVGIDAYWVLGVSEHCGSCVENAAKWNPLHLELVDE